MRGHLSERATVNGWCFECKSMTAKKHYKANPEPAIRRAKKRYEEKADEIKAYSLWYAKENKERHRENGRRWALKNRDKTAAYLRKYRKENPEKIRAFRINRRARMMNAEGSHDENDIMALYELQKGKCINCQVSFKHSGYHIDHIMPLAKGGSNWPSNLQLLCPSCNSRKSAKDPIQWANENGRLF